MHFVISTIFVESCHPTTAEIAAIFNLPLLQLSFIKSPLKKITEKNRVHLRRIKKQLPQFALDFPKPSAVINNLAHRREYEKPQKYWPIV